MQDIYQGTKAALAVGRSLGLKRFAFPLLGAGVAGLPRREVAEAMLRALRESASGGDLDVTLCAYSAADREALEGLL